MQMKVTVLGSGAWGTALAIVLVENGNDVTMWSHREEAVAEMQQLGVNPKLKGVPLPKELHLSSDLSCVSDSDVVVFATPSFAMRETAKRASSLVRSGTILVSVGKGIEKGSDLRMSQVIRSEISDDCPLVVLCGPTHAEEVGRKIPSGIVAASENQQAAEQVQDLFMNKRFRVYTSSDVVGVEICAAMKNVIALCVGMSDGMGFGDNTRALIITRGLAEITRLGTALGGRPETFAGLAGVGDLITTCTSVHSRNHQAGILIGGGMKPAEAIEKVGAVVEGYYAAATGMELAERMGLEMPITQAIYSVMYEDACVYSVSEGMMGRAKTHEANANW
jgi:glycerol-3-phosphate dehydrogenase (NAD(P)+)